MALWKARLGRGGASHARNGRGGTRQSTGLGGGGRGTSEERRGREGDELKARQELQDAELSKPGQETGVLL